MQKLDPMHLSRPSGAETIPGTGTPQPMRSSSSPAVGFKTVSGQSSMPEVDLVAVQESQQGRRDLLASREQLVRAAGLLARDAYPLLTDNCRSTFAM